VGLLAGHLPGHTEPVALSKLVIGSNMAQLMGMRLVAGRFLSDERAQDHFATPEENSTAAANEDRNILIDETAARNFGFTPQQAVGKTIVLDKSHVHVAGVIANVKFLGAREPAMATMYVYDPQSFG